MSDSSDNHDPVESTGAEVASPAESTHIDETPAAPDVPQQIGKEKSGLQEHIEKSMKKAQETGAAVEAPKPHLARPEEKPAEGTEQKPGSEDQGQAEKPGFQANFKYKAFGKEKEVDDFWKPLIKDAESEKKVKEVFTRADAFDEMKSRYETASQEQQRVLTQFTALDRDVRRVTTFLNKGDMDNFFASLRISDDMLLQHLQNKAEIQKLSPMQQQQYQAGVQQRHDQLVQQESFEQLQANYATQAVQARTMQLEMVLSRPDVERTASAFDTRMGHGAFRDLVTETARNHWFQTKEDVPADKAVQMTLERWGKLLEGPAAPQSAQNPLPISGNSAPQGAAPQQQATGVVMNQGKPVIPNVKGRGTSPVQQSPKSLADLAKIRKRLEAQEAQN